MSLDLLSFVLSHYGFLALLTLFACLVGARLTRNVVYDSVSEKFSVCTGLGLGIIASVVLLLGVLHLLMPGMILALFGISCVLLWPAAKGLRRDAEGAWRNSSWYRRLLCGMVFVLLTPVLLLPLYPPIHSDATSYHLAAAKIYATTNAVAPTPYLRFPVFPQLNEMLLTLALLLYDDLAAHLVQFLMMAVVATTLYAWGRRAFNTRVGLWGAALWLSNPLVLWLGASAYIDVSLASFLTLAVYAFFNWFQSRNTSWLLLSAAFFGFAAGVKYLALFPVLVFGMFLVYESLRTRTLRNILTFGVIFLIFAGPWYLRNAYYTSNPIWPYWGSALGYGPWSPEDAKNQIADQLHPGAGNGARALLLLPWNLAFRSGESFRAEYPLTPAYLFLLPICLLVAIRDSYLRVLLVVTGLYTLFWFATAQQMRYLIHALPLLSLAGGAALGNYVFRPRWSRSPTVAPALAVAICVLLVVPGALRTAVPGAFGTPLMPEQLPPVRAEDRDDYILKFHPIYSAVEFLNRTKGNDYTLYSLALSNMAYFADGRFLGDWFGPAGNVKLLNRFFAGDWVGPARRGEQLTHRSHPEELYQELRKLEVDHFMVNQTGGDADVFVDPVLAPNFLQGHFKLIYAHPALLFEVQERPVQLATGPEQMRNGGFEQLSGEVPANWLAVGEPLTDSTGAYGHDGMTAVRCNERNWLVQRVPVQSGSLYLLRHFTRVLKAGQLVRMQINWLDQNENQISSDVRVLRAGTDWRTHAMAAMAPENAAWAAVYASTHGDSEAWFDDFSLREIAYK